MLWGRARERDLQRYELQARVAVRGRAPVGERGYGTNRSFAADVLVTGLSLLAMLTAVVSTALSIVREKGGPMEQVADVRGGRWLIVGKTCLLLVSLFSRAIIGCVWRVIAQRGLGSMLLWRCRCLWCARRSAC